MFKSLPRLFFLFVSLSGFIYPCKGLSQSITGFSPATITAGTGSILTISGSGFGTTGPNTNIYVEFTGSSVGVPEVAALVSDYVSWSDNQIRLKVTTGAGTGVVSLVLNGNSLVSSTAALTVSYNLMDIEYNNVEYQTVNVNNNTAGGYTFQMSTAFNAKTEASQSFLRAIKTWECASNINWTIGTPTNVSVIADDGVNVIRFATSSEIDAGILGQTQSFFNSQDLVRWEKTGIDIVFADSGAYNMNFGPVPPTNNQYDFESVALHELGHAIGLGHVNDISDLMYKYTFNGGEIRTPNTNDLDAAKYLMLISTAPASTYIYPPMIALAAGTCNAMIPVISFFSPTSGGTGTTVTIKGINLTGVNSVSFGNTPAQTFSGISDTSITAVVAAGSTGNINVTTAWGLATIAGFVYKANQTISFSPLTSLTYGSPDFTPSATSSNNSIPFTYSSSNTAVATITTAGNIHIVGAGNTTITATQSGNTNFIAAVPVSQTLTVIPAALTITANNQTKIYGSQNPVFTMNYSGFVNGDNQASLTKQPSVTTTATLASAVNTYPVTVSGATASNYTFTYVAGILTVTPAVLTITADNESKNYGVANPALTLSYSGFVNGDNASSLLTQPIAVTTATTFSALGTYPITVSGAVSSNYTFIYVSGILTVGKNLLTITADNKSKNYSDPNPPLTISYSGFLNGDGPSVLLTPATATTTAITLSAVGSYPITVSGATSANYTIQFVPGNLVINPAPAPTISSVSPVTGLAGTTITITGTYFFNATSVSFGGVPASSFVVNSATSITAVVGAGASGNIEVTTPSGTGTISGFTFIFSLSQDNFKVTNTSSSCKGSNNGSINITTAASLSYKATVSENGVSTIYPFTDFLDINNLSPGTYAICITVAGQPDFSQCYSIINTEPKDLSVYSTVSNSFNTVNLSLSGAAQYNILLNGKMYTTSDNTIDLPLSAGNNHLVVTTDKSCQGSFEKNIYLSNSISFYPDPVQNILNLNLGMEILKNTTVEIHDVEGRLVYFKQYGNQSGVLQMDLRNLNSGVYALRLSADNLNKTFKILKQ